MSIFAVRGSSPTLMEGSLLCYRALHDCRATAPNSNVAFSARLYALPESDSVTAKASLESLAASPESLSASLELLSESLPGS